MSANSLIARMAQKFGVDPAQFFNTLKATAFKQRDGSAPTNEQMMALMVVADQYGLNPFTKEIYAFPDKQNGIIPVVGLDGWSRIINEHPSFDGIEFEYSQTLVIPDGIQIQCPEWIECILYRKDRSRPVRVREYLDETYRKPFKGEKNGRSYVVEGPWQTHPKRMLRHKAMIQSSRIGFGFSGIHDQDEAERIVEAMNSTGTGTAVVVQGQQTRPTPSQQATAMLTHEQMNPLLQQLTQRAIQANAWGAAHEYVKGRFSGENLVYATTFLNEKEAELQQEQAAASAQESQNTDEGHDRWASGDDGYNDTAVGDVEQGQFFG